MHRYFVEFQIVSDKFGDNDEDWLSSTVIVSLSYFQSVRLRL